MLAKYIFRFVLASGILNEGLHRFCSTPLTDSWFVSNVYLLFLYLSASAAGAFRNR